MKNYKNEIKLRSKETAREAIARIDRQHELLLAIFDKKAKKIIKRAQNSILLELQDEPDEIIATYNGRAIFKAPSSELFSSVIGELKKRMSRKNIDPESKIYTQRPGGELLDATRELKNGLR